MSFVNKVEKNNVQYDINDTRVYVLDLGNVDALMDGDGFQKAITGTDLVALYNAEEGIVKFTMDGMDAVCKVIAKGLESGSYMLSGSLFMPTGDDSYTTISLTIGGTSASGLIECAIYSVEIPSGGGGAGATIIEKTVQEIADETMISITETDYNNALNNDDVILKLTETESGLTYSCVKGLAGNVDVDMVVFTCLGEDVIMAALMKVEDEENPGEYLYMGMCMKQSMPNGQTTLYVHQVSVTDGNDSYIFKFLSREDSAVETYANFVDILSSYNCTFNINYIDEKADHYNIASVGYGSSGTAQSINYISSGSISTIQLSTFENMTFSDSTYTA